MRRLLGFFVRGLVLLAPLFVTVWVCWLVFTKVDGWLGLPIPGAGFVVTLLLITVVGFLGSNLLTRSAVSLLEGLMARLPFVRLLYGSTKDLLNAFVSCIWCWRPASARSMWRALTPWPLWCPAGCPDSFRPPFPLAKTPPSGSPNVF